MQKNNPEVNACRTRAKELLSKLSIATAACRLNHEFHLCVYVARNKLFCAFIYHNDENGKSSERVVFLS